jgi:hypothetical protein
MCAPRTFYIFTDAVEPYGRSHDKAMRVYTAANVAMTTSAYIYIKQRPVFQDGSDCLPVISARDALVVFDSDHEAMQTVLKAARLRLSIERYLQQHFGTGVELLENISKHYAYILGSSL